MSDVTTEASTERPAIALSAPSAAPVSPHRVVIRPSSSWLALNLRELWQYRDLLSLLVWRDFVAKYKQTILGPVWFVLQPLIMTLVFTVIFGRVAGLSTDGLPPVLFYLCGQLGWNYLANNFTANAATFTTNAPLFGKVYFPRLIVPLSIVISNLLAFGIQLVTFAVFFIYYAYVLGAHGFGLRAELVFLPLLILQIAALSLGAGLLMSAITAKYRDLSHLSPLLVQVWMYATPIILPLSGFPEKWRWIVVLNPMTFVVECFRLALLGSGEVNPGYAAVSVATTLLLLFLGLALFRRAERTFIDIV